MPPVLGRSRTSRDCSSSKASASPSVSMKQAGSSRKTTSAIFVNARSRKTSSRAGRAASRATSVVDLIAASTKRGIAMAEQRPYRLSGTAADTRLSQIKIVVLLSLGAAFVVVNWVTTQHAARLFGYSLALGEPWLDLRWAGKLYRPWDWMVWWSR